jgi:excisionase family DNA binding protein
MSLMSPKDLAEAWGVPLSWVYARVRARDIPHMKIGLYVRFDAEDVKQWLAERRRDAKACDDRGVAVAK